MEGMCKSMSESYLYHWSVTGDFDLRFDLLCATVISGWLITEYYAATSLL